MIELYLGKPVAWLAYGAIPRPMESEQMTNIVINLPSYIMPVESRGHSVHVDLSRIPHDIFLQLIPHALKQKISDAAANATRTIWNDVKGKDVAPSRDQLRDFAESHDTAIGVESIAQMHKVIDALYEGKWMTREGNGTSTKWNDTQSLALDMAKGTLKATFAKAAAAAGKANKIAGWVETSPKIAAFFNTGGKIVSWNDNAVMAWIDKQAEGGVDYMAQARDEMERRATLTQGADLDELLGDL